MRVESSFNRPASFEIPSLRGFVLLAVLVFAFGGTQTAQSQNAIPIQNSRELNAYQLANTQTDPKTKAAQLEGFLQTYPLSVAKDAVLDSLIDTYQSLNSADLSLSAASRLLEVNPDNMKAIFISVFIKKSQCAKTSDTLTCSDAAALARKGLAVAKPAGTSEDEWERLTKGTYPIFHSAIALDDIVSKKDLKAGIAEYRTELTLYSANQTKSGPGLWDTLQLAEAYVKQEAVDAEAAWGARTKGNASNEPKAARDADREDVAQAVWFYARAWNFAPHSLKTPIETKMKFYYSMVHGSLNGLDEIKTLAEAAVFPPSFFVVSPSTGSGRNMAQPGRRPAPVPAKSLALMIPEATALPLATPSAPGMPMWPANEKPTAASVTWDSQGLYVSANNSSLRQILREVATVTGATVEGLDTDERIFGDYGPGKAHEVLSQLLQGTSYNVLMIGDQGEGTPREIVLSSRHAADGTAAAGNPTPKADEDSETDEQPQQPPQQPPARPPFGPGGQRNPQQTHPQPGSPNQ